MKDCGAVALLAEGVDRNTLMFGASKGQQVALLAEGVDRNTSTSTQPHATSASPSSRRAWIEMVWTRHRQERGAVALLAEGVDRNKDKATGKEYR